MGAGGKLSRDAALHRGNAATRGGGGRSRSSGTEGAGLFAGAGRRGDVREGWAQQYALGGGGAQSAARPSAEQDRNGVAALWAGARAAALSAAPDPGAAGQSGGGDAGGVGAGAKFFP